MVSICTVIELLLPVSSGRTDSVLPDAVLTLQALPPNPKALLPPPSQPSTVSIAMPEEDEAQDRAEMEVPEAPIEGGGGGEAAAEEQEVKGGGGGGG